MIEIEIFIEVWALLHVCHAVFLQFLAHGSDTQWLFLVPKTSWDFIIIINAISGKYLNLSKQLAVNVWISPLQWLEIFITVATHSCAGAMVTLRRKRGREDDCGASDFSRYTYSERLDSSDQSQSSSLVAWRCSQICFTRVKTI